MLFLKHSDINFRRSLDENYPALPEGIKVEGGKFPFPFGLIITRAWIGDSLFLL
jgi:hypothetical protein